MNPYLVTQLRNAHDNGDLCREAADEIERLRAARVRLLLDLRDATHALSDFVRLTDPCPSCGGVRAQPRIASTGLWCGSSFHDDDESHRRSVLNDIAAHFKAVDNGHE